MEFKSDRARLSDRDLVEAIVCLANGDGAALPASDMDAVLQATA